MYYTDLKLLETRLSESGLSPDVQRAYLQILANLNAISMLLAPGDETEDTPSIAGEAVLERFFREHHARRSQMEEAYPILAILSRPAGWQGN